ncbi:MAG: esterase-like activity of phytase family protein, partial [Myxococcota bacterium]
MNGYASLDAGLEWLAPYGPQLRNGFTSHAPMVAEALCAMGRPGAVAPWLEGMRAMLKPRPQPSAAIAPGGWRSALGARTRGADWAELMRGELGDGPWQPFLRRWLRRLAPGYCSDALHGPIRVAHAVRALGVGETPQRRRELADALAAWAAAYQALPLPEPRRRGSLSPEEASLALPLQPEDERTFRGSIVSALFGVGRFDAFRPVIDWIDPGEKPERQVSSLTRAFARIYLANARDPLHVIVFVHGITSAAALRSLLPHLEAEDGRELLCYAWQAAAALHASFGRERPSAAPIEAPPLDRETLIDRAVASLAFWAPLEVVLSGRTRLGALLVLVGALSLAAGSAAGELVLEDLGDGPIEIPGIGDAELSGVVWLGGSRFLAVDDGQGLLVELDLTLDDQTGVVRSFVASVRATLADAQDPEGIAFRPGHESVLVVDEGHRDVREYDPSSGELLRAIAPPPRYEGRLKKNTGFESITSVPDGDVVWIATEGPLRRDGQGPTVSKGGWIRLQRFDAALTPVAQYAYQTESGFGYVGVVDLLATPEGELLVLERALVGTGFAARIFQVDHSPATDVTDF